MPSSKQLRTAIRVLEVFKEINGEMTLPVMLTMLYAAERDGMAGNQFDITERLGMTTATSSRSVSYWLPFKRPRVAGEGFMESMPDPEDRRYKMLTLTRQGQEFIKQLEDTVDGTTKRK